MALLRFVGLNLEDFEQLPVKDPNTRYIVFNEDGTVYGEFIGDELIGVKASDFESSIEELELEAERLDDEIERVEQKVDAHIEDVDNPHGVTAEQVGTYDKATIDDKDADTLQAAKDYTYSKADIDAKDASTLQAAKDFTYGKSVIDSKDANTLQEAKDYTYSRAEIDNKDASILQAAKDYADDRASEGMTAEKVKQLYESNPDTNAFTDAEKAKLAGIEPGAEVNTVNPEDLVADNISFDGSGTNYLAGETDVEGAIKELDARVKTNADNVALKVNISDIVDNLTSTAVDKPLSANQGKVLKDAVDVLDARVDDLELEVLHLDGEIGEVEQEIYEHIVDMNNPHGVTAEQVGTYDKEAIDQKDADILQEAKDFTYGKSVIDTKDADTLQAAKDYTDDRISEIADRLYEPDEVTIVFDEEGKLKVSEDLEIEWANVLDKPTFAAVATSGAYEDLIGKPNLDLKLDKDFSALPEQTNPLLTDVLVLNRGTTAQKVTLGSLLAQVDDEIFQVVSSLPTTGVANKIYLVPSSNPETQNVLDEFIWVDNDWEKIGAVSVDLSNYFNKTEINAMLEGKVDKNAPITPGTSTKITYDEKGLVTGGGSLVAADIPNLDASKITSGTFAAARIPNLDASKITSGVFNEARIPSLAISKITDLQDALDDLENKKVDKVPGKGLSTNDYTDADKSKVDSIDQVYTLAEKNKLASIEPGAQVNPTAQEIKVLYESNPDTNAYTDADKAKLASVETQVQNLSSELDDLQSQVGEVEDRVLGMWKLLYDGSTPVSTSSFTTIDLSDSIGIADVLAIEIRCGNASTDYNSRIVITAIGSSDATAVSSTFLRKIGVTDFDGQYFKNIYFAAYRYSATQIRVGHYSYLRGRFLPSSNTIEWVTEQTIPVYVTRIWKVM